MQCIESDTLKEARIGGVTISLFSLFNSIEAITPQHLEKVPDWLVSSID